MSRLWLGQPVHATDGPFGELADIVVDPTTRRVTHLVIEPHHQHLQARLVPVELVQNADKIVEILLDGTGIRHLQTVAESDFVAFDQAVDPGDGWDVGTEDVVTPTDDAVELEQGWDRNKVGVSYDRIPKGHCEIRRRSEVVADCHRVGHVDGFVADGDSLAAVIVRTGVPGTHHNVLVPMGSVVAVRNDRIDPSVSRDQFHRLPTSRRREG
ncbi:MAG: hypothetical protein OEW83_16190 [Acidimicrobiia bacterium]|nr:hypothetical protein [Acidimicrobiia bacterium]